MKYFEKEINFFREFGYLQISSLVDKEYIESFEAAFFEIFKTYSGLNTTKNFDSEDFVTVFKKFRQKNEVRLNGLFRSITKIQSFKNLFSNEKVLRLLGEIFNMPSAALIISEYQFRIDEPKDNLFTLDWHQDGAYYEQDKDGKSGIVLNVCIQNCKKEMGSPELVKGSHKDGKFKSKKYHKAVSNTLQHNTNSEHIDKNKIVILEPHIGDVVIYDMNLIHKSGFNFSNKSRFSAISRAFNPLSSSFVPFYFSDKKLLEY